MKAEIVNCFLQAAIDVLHMETKGDITRKNLSRGTNQFSTAEVNVYLGVIGQIEGCILICCSEKTACGIIGAILNTEITEVTDDVKDGISEVGNCITGKASVLLDELGYSFDITPPSVIIGSGAQIKTLQIPTIDVSLNTPFDEFQIKLGLRFREKKS